MNEIKTMLSTILENQKITNAKIEALTMDVRQLQGDVTVLKEDGSVLKENVAEIKTLLNEVSQSAEFLVHKTGEHEKEIFVLKRKQKA
ncbi:hypothetical protein [Effusibacillus consociatus]|uniref:Uncharacterized protein n=1 Tax=Effusibacillus consociatus TaxID=1117041 RepID=A0ABV9Q5X9_9BACL